ncbi:MAG: glycosyltransferase family 2 protein [Gammaproteobacteria bacterium]
MTKPNLPTISIVTPSFNQGRFVEATVRSVFEQRYPRLEYLFLDGGSSDDTLDRIGAYRSRFAYFRSAPDGGQSAAIAEGFSRAGGEILAYLNSDDLLLPGTLNFVADYFKRHPEVDLIYSHRCFIDADNRVTGHWILPPHSNYLMRRWDLIPQETCFWRRRLFENHGNIDPSFWFAMDYELFVRYMRTAKFKRVNRFLAAFRVHDQAKTSTHLSSTGAQEVSRVQKQYDIRLIPLIGKLFFLSVQLRAALFARRHESFPGLPPGIDYRLDDLWG